MVLQIKAPALKILNPWIESLLAKRYGYRKVSLRKYRIIFLVAEELSVPAYSILKEITHSHSIHAVSINGIVFIHPDALFLLRKVFLRKLIRKELKKSF